MRNRLGDEHRPPDAATPPARSSLFPPLVKPETRVALVAAIALILEAVVAKNVLEVELDYASQFAPLWVFIVFLITEERGRVAELGAIAVIVAVTTAVLALYAVW
jgi:hypothetical protein